MKCNIYLNSGGRDHDISVNINSPVNSFIMVDTLTTIGGDDSFVASSEFLDLSYEHTLIEQIDHDLYVAPWGDDSNSGLSENDPLKTIHYALYMILADSMNAKNVFLAPGIYSRSTTGEKFPINCKSGVSIIGSGRDNTIIDLENEKLCFWSGRDKNVAIKNLQINNGRSHLGGAIVVEFESSATLENIAINNCTAVAGSAIGLYTSDVKADNIVIDNCRGDGIIYVRGSLGDKFLEISNISVTNSTLLPDAPNQKGGRPMLVLYCPKLKLSNCMIASNDVVNDYYPYGFLSFFDIEDLRVSNMTVVDNTVTFGGHLMLGGIEKGVFKNCIITNDTYCSIVKETYPEHGAVSFSNSVIENYWDVMNIVGTGYHLDLNMDESVVDCDPGFVGFGDIYQRYHLRPDSYCIDAGGSDTTGLNLPQYDFLGDERFYGGRIDMGCFEYLPVEADNEIIPSRKITMNCFPNPLSIGNKRSKTNILNITMTLPGSMAEIHGIQLEIYNVKGQLVRMIPVNILNDLRDGPTNSISQNVQWDLKDANDVSVGVGVYIFALKYHSDIVCTTRGLLLK